MSPAGCAERAARLWTLVALAVLLLFQIYWIIGSALMSDLEGIEQKYVIETTAYRASRADKGDTGSAELTAIQERLYALEIRRGAVSDVLQKINALRMIVLPREVEDRLGSVPIASGAPTVVKARQVESLSMQFTLKILSLFVLPLLWGWLGGCVFVIRALADEIRRRVYTEISNIGNRLRMYLGALAGLVAGWVINPTGRADTVPTGESFVSVEALSPFALAFIAGYSVELVFFTLERLVATFTAPNIGASVAARTGSIASVKSPRR